MHSISHQQYQTANTAIVHEFLDDEVIVANLDTGSYYSLRGSAIPIWQLLVAGIELGDIVNALHENYPDLSKDLVNNIPIDIQTLLSTLVNHGLLIPRIQANKPSIKDQVVEYPQPYATALIEIYSEMTDLLMLDPVHEVDTQGWPKRPDSK